MHAHLALGINDSSDPGEVRRQAIALAGSAGFSPADAGRAALVVTEAATNILKHADKGVVLLRAVDEVTDRPGLEAIALDNGPGMADVARCMEDGYSTAGSPGTGLGAISRVASLLEIYSAPAKGTALLLRVFPPGAKELPARGPLVLGAVRVPAPGETACGDDWGVKLSSDQCLVLVADGLGHGPEAARAAGEAVRVFEASAHLSAPDLFQRLHGALLATRGAAVSMTEVLFEASEARFTGIGNVAGFITWPGGSKSMVSQNGMVGGQAASTRVFTYPWRPDALLTMYTDGLNSHTSLDGYPGLLSRHPSLIAAVLYRDFGRGRDDATVVVAAERRAAS